MNNKSARAIANLAMLEFIARKLGKLKDEVVFLGGCTTALIITDPLSLDIRPTLDVDCIVNVDSLAHYYQFEKKLSEQGFKKSLEDDVIYRWRYEDVILDVMPTDEKILGFGNRWYREAIAHAVTYQIAEDLTIKLVTAPYFLATKLEAFKTRGNNDFLGSHDFEDIINLIDGRVELIDELAQVNSVLRKYLAKNFSEILKNEQFQLALPGHLNVGAATAGRVQVVLGRIKQIVDMNA